MGVRVVFTMHEAFHIVSFLHDQQNSINVSSA